MLPDYELSAKSAEEFMEDAARFWYDVALSGNESTLGLLTRFAAPGRILFGLDFPYAPERTVRTLTAGLDRFDMGVEVRKGVARGNAEGLFPRLMGGGGGLSG